MANGDGENYVTLHETAGVLLRGGRGIYFITDEALQAFKIVPDITQEQLSTLFQNAADKWDAARIDLIYRGDSG